MGWYSTMNKSKYSVHSKEISNPIANPLLSMCFESNMSFGLEENDGHGAEPSHKQEDYSDSYDNHDNHDEVFHDDVDTLNRKTMAITKFEVMLHDLLLKHKASLLLYDEIIDLVSIYITSPNFNRFDTLKSRKKLLRSTEKSQQTSGLCPINGIVRLHNNSFVTQQPVS